MTNSLSLSDSGDVELRTRAKVVESFNSGSAVFTNVVARAWCEG